MPSRIQNHVLPAVAGAKPPRAIHRSADLLESERSSPAEFAETLSRARSKTSKPEVQESERPVAKKPTPRKSKAADGEPREEPSASSDAPRADADDTTVDHDNPTDPAEPVADVEVEHADSEKADRPSTKIDANAAVLVIIPQAASVPTDANVAEATEGEVTEASGLTETSAVRAATVLTPTAVSAIAAASPEIAVDDDGAAQEIAGESALDAFLAAIGLAEPSDEPHAVDADAKPSTAQATVTPAQPRPAQSQAQVPALPTASDGADQSDTSEQSGDAPKHARDAESPSMVNAELPGVIDGLSGESSSKPIATAPSAHASEINAPIDTPRPAAPHAPQPAAPQIAPAPRPMDFAATNHEKIVTSVRSELLPRGGSMEIRLDPPELGALQVSVRMENGIMSASFQTSSDEATRLLSHSLGQLKHVLESAGVTVDKLQVQQSPKSDHEANANDQRNGSSPDDASARQEQQRKEMIRRMWRKLAGTSDPLDLVA